MIQFGDVYMYTVSARLPFEVRQELPTAEQCQASLAKPGTQQHMKHVLERENNAVAFGVGLLVDADLAVDHGHDAVAELLVDERLDGRTVDEHTLRRET